MHLIVKEATNRHTPLGTSIEKISEEVNKLINTYEKEI